MTSVTDLLAQKKVKQVESTMMSKNFQSIDEISVYFSRIPTPAGIKNNPMLINKKSATFFIESSLRNPDIKRAQSIIIEIIQPGNEKGRIDDI